MNIYISHSSKYDYINKLYNPLKSSILNKTQNFYFPHDAENMVSNTKEIISNSDLIIAEVSLPATGQGIELGWANFTNKPILCIYEKGIEISSSLHFITDNFIEYNNSDDMIFKITKFVESMK